MSLVHRSELKEAYGIVFSRLFALNNMPIKRYVDYLQRRNSLAEYMQLLVDNFNPSAAEVSSASSCQAALNLCVVTFAANLQQVLVVAAHICGTCAYFFCALHLRTCQAQVDRSRSAYFCYSC